MLFSHRGTKDARAEIGIQNPCTDLDFDPVRKPPLDHYVLYEHTIWYEYISFAFI